MVKKCHRQYCTNNVVERHRLLCDFHSDFSIEMEHRSRDRVCNFVKFDKFVCNKKATYVEGHKAFCEHHKARYISFEKYKSSLKKDDELESTRPTKVRKTSSQTTPSILIISQPQQSQQLQQSQCVSPIDHENDSLLYPYFLLDSTKVVEDVLKPLPLPPPKPYVLLDLIAQKYKDVMEAYQEILNILENINAENT